MNMDGFNRKKFNKYNDRRKGPDFLVKWVRWASLVAWLLFIGILAVTLQAKPELEDMWTQMFNVRLRRTWDKQLLTAGFIMMIILFTFCLVSLLFNVLRRRRKTDKINSSLIFLTITSFIGILISLFTFIL